MAHTDLREALGWPSRRLLSSTIRHFIYSVKARDEPTNQKYDRLVGIEEGFYEAAYLDWRQAVDALGDVRVDAFRLAVLAVMLEAQTIAIPRVRDEMEDLGVPALNEIARFIETFDYDSFLPRVVML